MASNRSAHNRYTYSCEARTTWGESNAEGDAETWRRNVIAGDVMRRLKRLESRRRTVSQPGRLKPKVSEEETETSQSMSGACTRHKWE